nr:glycosyl hydrolase [Acidobacteriota bacterium]
MKTVRTRLLLLAGASVLVGGALAAQQPAPPASAARLVNASTDPLLQGFRFRSIGPAVMGGRIDDIEGAEKDPLLIYVGFATSGLWKSTDGGFHFESVFDEMPNASVGDIAIAPSNPDVVYVGMGEPNNRQSSSIGNGVYGTKDGGKTWQHLGLDDSQSIGRIAVSPTDPNVVFVAAMGHLFGPNEERGLYKSIDGGKTWKKSKYIDADTGFNEVVIDPVNPKVMYASSYQRRRTWWGYNGGGPGSGVWKSMDAGETWTKLSGGGFPAPADGILGRIGLSVYKAKPSTIYMIAEVGAEAG